VLAATNRAVEQAIANKLLREDLYYRLNAFHIHIPPLRQRKEDIPPLVDALIHSLNERHGCRVVDLDPEALALLLDYSWPGNIRELRNVIEWSVITAREGTITASQLRPSFRSASGQEHALPIAGSSARKPPSSQVAPFTFEDGRPLHELEEDYIQHTLKLTGNNKRKAAAILGISLRTLYARLSEVSAGEKAPGDASARASAG
jgi:DNA-binding NtrC family response regulator